MSRAVGAPFHRDSCAVPVRLGLPGVRLGSVRLTPFVGSGSTRLTLLGSARSPPWVPGAGRAAPRQRGSSHPPPTTSLQPTDRSDSTGHDRDGIAEPALHSPARAELSRAEHIVLWSTAHRSEPQTLHRNTRRDDTVDRPQAAGSPAKCSCECVCWYQCVDTGVVTVQGRTRHDASESQCVNIPRQ